MEEAELNLFTNEKLFKWATLTPVMLLLALTHDLQKTVGDISASPFSTFYVIVLDTNSITIYNTFTPRLSHSCIVAQLRS